MITRSGVGCVSGGSSARPGSHPEGTVHDPTFKFSVDDGLVFAVIGYIALDEGIDRQRRDRAGLFTLKQFEALVIDR